MGVKLNEVELYYSRKIGAPMFCALCIGFFVWFKEINEVEVNRLDMPDRVY